MTDCVPAPFTCRCVNCVGEGAGSREGNGGGTGGVVGRKGVEAGLVECWDEHSVRHGWFLDKDFEAGKVRK
jgi:hypothetical protein